MPHFCSCCCSFLISASSGVVSAVGLDFESDLRAFALLGFSDFVALGDDGRFLRAFAFGWGESSIRLDMSLSSSTFRAASGSGLIRSSSSSTSLGAESLCPSCSCSSADDGGGEDSIVLRFFLGFCCDSNDFLFPVFAFGFSSSTDVLASGSSLGFLDTEDFLEPALFSIVLSSFALSSANPSCLL